MNQPEIIRVNGPVPVGIRPRKDVHPDPATAIIYSVQLPSGLIVTSPDTYPPEPATSPDDAP